jgi:hypothetical protein
MSLLSPSLTLFERIRAVNCILYIFNWKWNERVSVLIAPHSCPPREMAGSLPPVRGARIMIGGKIDPRCELFCQGQGFMENIPAITVYRLHSVTLIS